MKSKTKTSAKLVIYNTKRKATVHYKKNKNKDNQNELKTNSKSTISSKIYKSKIINVSTIPKRKLTRKTYLNKLNPLLKQYY